MFAVGVNSSPTDFVEAFKKPVAIAAGYVGQFIIKPLLGYLFGIIAVSIFNLPNPLGDKCIHSVFTCRFLRTLSTLLLNQVPESCWCHVLVVHNFQTMQLS